MSDSRARERKETTRTEGEADQSRLGSYREERGTETEKRHEIAITEKTARGDEIGEGARNDRKGIRWRASGRTAIFFLFLFVEDIVRHRNKWIIAE